MKEFTISEDNGTEVKLAVKKPTSEDYEESDKVYRFQNSFHDQRRRSQKESTSYEERGG